jgi:hypothetical protein
VLGWPAGLAGIRSYKPESWLNGDVISRMGGWVCKLAPACHKGAFIVGNGQSLCAHGAEIRRHVRGLLQSVVSFRRARVHISGTNHEGCPSAYFFTPSTGTREVLGWERRWRAHSGTQERRWRGSSLDADNPNPTVFQNVFPLPPGYHTPARDSITKWTIHLWH